MEHVRNGTLEIRYVEGTCRATSEQWHDCSEHWVVSAPLARERKVMVLAQRFKLFREVWVLSRVGASNSLREFRHSLLDSLHERICIGAIQKDESLGIDQ